MVSFLKIQGRITRVTCFVHVKLVFELVILSLIYNYLQDIYLTFIFILFILLFIYF